MADWYIVWRIWYFLRLLAVNCAWIGCTSKQEEKWPTKAHILGVSIATLERKRWFPDGGTIAAVQLYRATKRPDPVAQSMSMGTGAIRAGELMNSKTDNHIFVTMDM